MDTCDIIFIMDRSGSMSTIRGDAIGGYNTMLAEQKGLPGDCAWTLVTFDHFVTREYTRKVIKDAPPLTQETYVPGGMTALYDAIGQTLTEARTWVMPSNPEHKVIVAIMTDGLENSSQEFTTEKIKELTDEFTAKGWIFQYMGANQDAFAVAGTINMANQYTQNYAATPEGTRMAFGVSGQSLTTARGYAADDPRRKPPPDPTLADTSKQPPDASVS